MFFLLQIRLKWKRRSDNRESMLKCIIFDFNGVLVDDEPVHLKMFQTVLKEEGISLNKKDYYERYLGMDDRGCFKAAYQDQGRNLDETSLAELIQRKALYYRQSMEKGVIVFPGVEKLIPDLFSRFPLAIASGALRSEIEIILESITLRKYFQVIVSTEDVSQGKPNPEIFIKALSLLNEQKISARSIHPLECLVVEDSKEGILAAHRAGMRCLAVANSHLAEELTEAEAVVKGLDEVTIPFLEKLFP
ncbi:MAG: HAD family phosphatase [Deltaproteobacteria bacterium]|nr:HAD family phosphatase [Deltaproteobacteria bacterium]